jgi:hypothetical protein
MYFQVCFDNVDTYVQVHSMTEDHQNIDSHECIKAFVPNRVSGYPLQFDNPQADVNSTDNGTFIFDKSDHVLQRQNYIILVQKIICEDIDCLSIFKDVVCRHILHKHSKELSGKVDMVIAI